MKRRTKGEDIPGGVVAYVRVSTSSQDVGMQRHAIEELARTRDLPIGRWFEDQGSGRQQARAGWSACMDAIRMGQVRVLFVYRFDRIGRSLSHLITVVEELRKLNVRLIVVSGGIDTETPAGRAMFGMAAVFAEFEADLITERVHAGLERARAEGTRLGRPPRISPEEAHAAVVKHGGVRPAARALNLPASTVSRALDRGGSHA